MTFVARCWVRIQASHRAAVVKYAGSRTLQHFSIEASMQTLGTCRPKTNATRHVQYASLYGKARTLLLKMGLTEGDLRMLVGEE